MKTMIITGGNSGLGFETAKKIAKDKSYEVIIACRSAEKAAAAVSSIKQETGNENVGYRLLDLASLKSVRDFAKAYKAEGKPLYGLLCNAGISGMRANRTTEDGYELIFQSNYLGHFLLINLLLECIQPNGRMMLVSSDMHCPPGPELKWQGVAYLTQANEDKRKYAYSKLCNLYNTYKLNEILQERHSAIVVNAFNPGYMSATSLMGEHKPTPEQEEAIKAMGRFGELSTSSTALAELMTKETYGKSSGLYYDRSTNAVKSSPLSYNHENAEELWETSKQLTGLI